MIATSKGCADTRYSGMCKAESRMESSASRPIDHHSVAWQSSAEDRIAAEFDSRRQIKHAGKVSNESTITQTYHQHQHQKNEEWTMVLTSVLIQAR
jgi:hypothetical protein